MKPESILPTIFAPFRVKDQGFGWVLDAPETTFIRMVALARDMIESDGLRLNEQAYVIGKYVPTKETVEAIRQGKKPQHLKMQILGRKAFPERNTRPTAPDITPEIANEAIKAGIALEGPSQLFAWIPLAKAEAISTRYNPERPEDTPQNRNQNLVEALHSMIRQASRLDLIMNMIHAGLIQMTAQNQKNPSSKKDEKDEKDEKEMFLLSHETPPGLLVITAMGTMDETPADVAEKHFVDISHALFGDGEQYVKNYHQSNPEEREDSSGALPWRVPQDDQIFPYILAITPLDKDLRHPGPIAVAACRTHDKDKVIAVLQRALRHQPNTMISEEDGDPNTLH